MSELDDALARLDATNANPYSTGNPYGLTGRGAMTANWVPGLRAVATIYRAIVALNNSLNFLAAQASVATILQRCQELVAQITMGSTSALSFPSVDKALLSAADVVAVYVYDTRLDDRLPDGGRWNEPGRCSHTSWWIETLNTAARGAKRDFPVVALIVAQPAKVTIYDAMDLDAAGAPRMWKVMITGGFWNGSLASSSFNAIGAGAVLKGCHARNGRLLIASNDALVVLDWANDRATYHGASAITVGTYRGGLGQANAGLGHNAVGAAMLSSVPANAVHAHVYPGAPLDAAGMPVPTIAVGLDTTAAVIHPAGQVVTITGFNNPVTHIALTPDARLLLTGVYYSTVEALRLPYASADRSALLAEQYYYPSYGAAPDRLLLPASEGITRLVAHNGGFACNFGGRGMLQVHRDHAAPHNGMRAQTAIDFTTGWQPGDTRLAALCDATTGAIAGSGELVSNPGGPFASTAGYTAVNGVGLAVDGGDLIITAAGSGQSARMTITTVVGQAYLVAATIRQGTTTAGVRVGVAGVVDSATVNTTTATQVLVQFTATAASHSVDFYIAGASGTARMSSLSVKLAAADRSYKGKGLTVTGPLQRGAVAPGADMVLWSGWAADAYVEQPYNADLDVGAGDFWIIAWTTATAGSLVERGTAGLPTGHVRLAATGGGYQFTVVDSATAFGGVASATPALLAAQRVGGVLELWVNGAKVSTASGPAISTTLAGAVTRIGCAIGGSSPANGGIAMVRYGAGALTPAQIRRIYEDERHLMQGGAKCLLGGTSSAVAALDRDPLTGRLAVGTGDGVSVFKGLRRVSYLDEAVLAATTSDTVRSVALRGPSLLIGTAAEVGFVGDAIGGKEAIAVGGPRPVGGGFVARGVTTDGATLDLAPRVPIGERETVLVETRIIGRVTGPADTERLTYIRRGTYYRDAGGAITLQGTVQTEGTDTEVTGTADATLAIAGDWVSARVTGVSGKRIRWEATFTITRLSEETSYAA